METDGTVEMDKRTEKHVMDDVWITVESKQERKAKRLQSCMNTGKTRSVSHMNGKSGFWVKFGDSCDSLILINLNFRFTGLLRSPSFDYTTVPLSDWHVGFVRCATVVSSAGVYWSTPEYSYIQ